MVTIIHDQNCGQAYDIELSDHQFINANFSDDEHNYQ